MAKKEMCVILAVVLLLLPALVAVAGAQEVPSLPPPSPWVSISANPSEIPADDVSTSELKVVVVLPAKVGGGPANTSVVDIWTTLGWLIEAGNESNSGSKISLVTDYNGTAIALLSGNETGVAEIKVQSSVYKENITSTSVTFLEPGATPSPTAPSGNGGDGGIPPTPPAGTPAYIALNANPADIPADGISTSTITASVWNGEEWVLGNLTANFSTSLGNITESAVIMNGTATAILTAGMEEGAATITAEANLPEIGIVNSTTAVNFTTPAVTPAVNVTATPTVMVSPTPTATVSPAPSPTKKPLIPGFEAVFAIAGLLTVAYLVLKRGREAQP